MVTGMTAIVRLNSMSLMSSTMTMNCTVNPKTNLISTCLRTTLHTKEKVELEQKEQHVILLEPITHPNISTYVLIHAPAKLFEQLRCDQGHEHSSKAEDAGNGNDKWLDAWPKLLVIRVRRHDTVRNRPHLEDLQDRVEDEGTIEEQQPENLPR